MNKSYKNNGDDGQILIEKKKTKRKRRKQKDGARFAIIIFYAGIAAFIVAVIIGVALLKDEVTKYLYDYESNLPQYTVDSIFNEYFADPDFNKLLDMAGYEENDFSEKEDIVSYLDAKVEGKEIKYVYVAGTDRKKVNVRADGEKIASFTIETDDYPSEYGFDRYKLGEIKLFYQATESVTVTVPFNCTVEINGVLLTEDHIVQKDITDDNRTEIPEGTYKFSYTKYKVKNLLTEPDVVVKDVSGKEVEAEYNEEKNEYSVSFKYDDTLKVQYEDYVLKAMKLYACRMQNDASFSDCKGYFEPDTPLYEQIRANPGSFVWEHDGYSFEDEWTGEYYMYESGVMRCHVKFNHILHMKGKEDHPDPVDLVLYMRADDSGKYKIFAMETN